MVLDYLWTVEYLFVSLEMSVYVSNAGTNHATQNECVDFFIHIIMKRKEGWLSLRIMPVGALNNAVRN